MLPESVIQTRCLLTNLYICTITELYILIVYVPPEVHLLILVHIGCAKRLNSKGQGRNAPIR